MSFSNLDFSRQTPKVSAQVVRGSLKDRMQQRLDQAKRSETPSGLLPATSESPRSRDDFRARAQQTADVQSLSCLSVSQRASVPAEVPISSLLPKSRSARPPATPLKRIEAALFDSSRLPQASLQVRRDSESVPSPRSHADDDSVTHINTDVPPPQENEAYQQAKAKPKGRRRTRGCDDDDGSPRVRKSARRQREKQQIASQQQCHANTSHQPSSSCHSEESARLRCEALSFEVARSNALSQSDRVHGASKTVSEQLGSGIDIVDTQLQLQGVSKVCDVSEELPLSQPRHNLDDSSARQNDSQLSCSHEVLDPFRGLGSTQDMMGLDFLATQRCGATPHRSEYSLDMPDTQDDACGFAAKLRNDGAFHHANADQDTIPVNAETKTQPVSHIRKETMFTGGKAMLPQVPSFVESVKRDLVPPMVSQSDYPAPVASVFSSQALLPPDTQLDAEDVFASPSPVSDAEKESNAGDIDEDELQESTMSGDDVVDSPHACRRDSCRTSEPDCSYSDSQKPFCEVSEHMPPVEKDLKLQRQNREAFEAGVSVARAMQMLMAGRADAANVSGLTCGQTLEEELREFAGAIISGGFGASKLADNISSQSVTRAMADFWTPFGGHTKEGIANYVNYLKDKLDLPGVDERLSGGASMERFLAEVDVALRLVYLPPETLARLPRMAAQLQFRGGYTSAMTVLGGDEFVEQSLPPTLFIPLVFAPLKSRLTYVVLRLQWILQKQRALALEWMGSASSNPAFQFSPLFTKHYALLHERGEAARRVFDALDEAARSSAEQFSETMEAMLTACCQKPAALLKQSSKVDALDVASPAVAPRRPEPRERVREELRSRQAGALTQPGGATLQNHVVRAFVALRSKLAVQARGFAQAALLAFAGRQAEEALLQAAEVGRLAALDEVLRR